MIDFHLLSRTYVLLHNTANCALCPNRRGSMHVLERSDQQNLSSAVIMWSDPTFVAALTGAVQFICEPI